MAFTPDELSVDLFVLATLEEYGLSTVDASYFDTFVVQRGSPEG